MSEDLTPKRDYMDGANINWRHEKPNYDLVNAKYLKERKSNIKAGSIAKLVEDLVKTWEMESSHKMSEKVGTSFVYIQLHLFSTGMCFQYLYSNKKETSDFHGTVSFDPGKISQQK